MASRARRTGTIKSYAEELLIRESYVDINGRSVGLDYRHILDLIRERFPVSRTSLKELQKIAYSLNTMCRMPVRRRSRKILAHDYAQTLLLRDIKKHSSISTAVRKKFTDQHVTLAELRKLETRLRNQKFDVPAHTHG